MILNEPAGVRTVKACSKAPHLGKTEMDEPVSLSVRTICCSPFSIFWEIVNDIADWMWRFNRGAMAEKKEARTPIQQPVILIGHYL